MDPIKYRQFQEDDVEAIYNVALKSWLNTYKDIFDEDFVRSKGESKYDCFVHKDNQLGKNFYLKKGFEHISEKDSEDELYMEKEITG